MAVKDDELDFGGKEDWRAQAEIMSSSLLC